MEQQQDYFSFQTQYACSFWADGELPGPAPSDGDIFDLCGTPSVHIGSATLSGPQSETLPSLDDYDFVPVDDSSSLFRFAAADACESNGDLETGYDSANAIFGADLLWSSSQDSDVTATMILPPFDAIDENSSLGNFACMDQSDISYETDLLHFPQAVIYPSRCSTKSVTPPFPTIAEKILISETSSIPQPLVHSPDQSESAAFEFETYSCTYTGCDMCFNEITYLKRHEKDTHRKLRSLQSMNLAQTLFKNRRRVCQRTNPQTRKPCNTEFARPYDLTRHESAVHDPHRQKIRCQMCFGERQFSRADAWVRHIRVEHSIKRCRKGKGSLTSW